MSVCVYMRACYCAEERGRRENKKSQENEKEEASISFLELSHDIMNAKQAVVARGDFRELPLL